MRLQMRSVSTRPHEVRPPLLSLIGLYLFLFELVFENSAVGLHVVTLVDLVFGSASFLLPPCGCWICFAVTLSFSYQPPYPPATMSTTSYCTASGPPASLADCLAARPTHFYCQHTHCPYYNKNYCYYCFLFNCNGNCNGNCNLGRCGSSCTAEQLSIPTARLLFAERFPPDTH
jgi:hypothetical protein